MAYTTINKSSLHQGTLLYVGDETNNRAITGVGFQPDLVWFKSRGNTYWHQLFDIVRGVNKSLATNDTNAQENRTDALESFDSDGFTIDNGANQNQDGQIFVSWNWKAGGGQGSSNTDGSINTTYTSVNTTAGFSISQYTGTGSAATVGHGLGAVPKLIIIKKLNSSTGGDWYVYHASNGNDSKIWLNQNSAKGTGTHMNNTTPTSSVFSIGTPTEVNNSGDTYIAYCFAEKVGYSKFGEYSATGSSSLPPFIYTGFKPQFVMTKGKSVADQWSITDTARDDAVGGGNGTGARLTADSNSAESTNATWASIQKYSNGFSPQGNDNVTNGSGQTYIYMAFGQTLVGTNGVTAKAR